MRYGIEDLIGMVETSGETYSAEPMFDVSGVGSGNPELRKEVGWIPIIHVFRVTVGSLGLTEWWRCL